MKITIQPFFYKILILLFITLFFSSNLFCKQLSNNQIKQIYYFNKTWGLVKYYNSKQASKLNIDRLYIEYFQIIDNEITNSEFNKIISRFLNEFNLLKNKKQFENFQELKSKHSWIYDSIIFEKQNTEKLEAIIKYFKASKNKYVKNKLSGALAISDSVYFYNTNPDKNLRMLALARYWNTIYYFYPYTEMLTENWDSTLIKFIPKLYIAEGIAEYSKTFLLLISTINDSHGFTYNKYLNKDLWGYYEPLFKISLIENKTIVTSIIEDNSTIKIGDIILEINNIEIDKLRDSINSFICASNYASKNRILNQYILSNKDSITHLKILRKTDTLKIAYQNAGMLKHQNSYIKNKALMPKIFHFPNEISYINLEAIYRKDLKKIIKEINNDKLLIIDLRGYPNGLLFKLLKYLSSSKTQFACLKVPNTKKPCLFKNLSYYYCGSNKTSKFKGKIVLLVNENTQSQAEFTAMALQTLSNLITVGNQSAGADGDIVNVMLPGKLTTMFSSINITYPNGEQTQGKGVHIDYYVYPTIEGICNEKDELVDYVLKENLKLFEKK